jgi:hypothetical protein
MSTLTGDFDDSYGYEPDWKDLEYDRYRESYFEALRQGHGDLDRRLRDHNRTDRQLRETNRERNGIARELFSEWHFHVTTDAFEVLDDDLNTIALVPRKGSSRVTVDRSKFSRPFSRKDKRRAKTKERREARKFQIWRTQREKSHAASVVRKTGALPTVVAGMCQA